MALVGLIGPGSRPVIGSPVLVLIVFLLAARLFPLFSELDLLGMSDGHGMAAPAAGELGRLAMRAHVRIRVAAMMAAIQLAETDGSASWVKGLRGCVWHGQLLRALTHIRVCRSISPPPPPSPIEGEGIELVCSRVRRLIRCGHLVVTTSSAPHRLAFISLPPRWGRVRVGGNSPRSLRLCVSFSHTMYAVEINFHRFL